MRAIPTKRKLRKQHQTLCRHSCGAKSRVHTSYGSPPRSTQTDPFIGFGKAGSGENPAHEPRQESAAGEGMQSPAVMDDAIDKEEGLSDITKPSRNAEKRKRSHALLPYDPVREAQSELSGRHSEVSLRPEYNWSGLT